AVVYFIVAALILHAVRRGRKEEAPALDVEDPSTRRFDDRMITWGGVFVPLLILLFLAVVTVRTTNALRRPAAGALRIDVVGRRWWWEVDYPGAKFTTANEIHLPEGRPIEVVLTTDDVIHSFWVPQLAGKVDTIPNQRNTLRFTATKSGTYAGECAE